MQRGGWHAPGMVRRSPSGRPAALSQARPPQRRRGRERFARLLDVTEALLVERPDADVTLAMIAERAGVPLPSVYHFFPNRNAILIELARRYHQDLTEQNLQPLTPPPDSWQGLVRARHAIGRDYLNAHPAALRLFMGAGVSVEVRTLDLNGNTSMAGLRAAQMRARFDCRGLDGLDAWLGNAFGLIDGIWAISWARHGVVTDPYLEESLRAAVAYLRCYLPEHLPVLPAGGGKIVE